MPRAVDDLRARCALVLSLAACLVLVSPACSERMELGTIDPDGGRAPVGFEGNPDDAAEAGTSPAADPDGSTAGLCPSNTCPAGRTTCPNNPFPCAVDLLSNDDNCGACGRYCPRDSEYSATFGLVTRCIDGECTPICNAGKADCNGRPEDGCETTINGSDKNNCGGCGVTCADICIQGNCGCPAGWTFCSETGTCADLDGKEINADNNNCGACGRVCPDVPQPPSEWNAIRHCNLGQCGQLWCRPWRLDCNGDLGNEAGDGCETDASSDPNNCGACGKVCAPGQRCSAGKCLCTAGEVNCFGSCVQVEDDIDNCGACRNRCIGERSAPGALVMRGQPICERGVCGYACAQHWGDCDGDVMTGCETNLLDDPLNCGGCGIRCDRVEGQACIDGQCAMKPCDEVK